MLRRLLPAPRIALLLAIGLTACGDDPAKKPPADAEDSGEPSARPPVPEVAPGAPALRRLTRTQYENALEDTFLVDLYVPTAFEPDNEVEGLLSVGASTTSVSAYGVELYEQSAQTVADQVLADLTARTSFLSCTPSGASDAACAGEALGLAARKLWRRPVTEDEQARLGALAAAVGAESGDFDEGLRTGLVAILQSPHFLYRIENGAGEGDLRPLSPYELASRLSFLLWNSIPDEALLAKAADGSLAEDEVLEAEARRMLDDARARRGLRNLFDEVFHLYTLPTLSKDPLAFANASPELGPSAREETLLGIERLVLDEDGDFKDLFTTQRAFVDRRLAALYNVAAATPDGFGEVILPEAGGRRGLFGQASFLMLQAHANSTSATRRGKFVRTTVLCQEIPAPPANVDTSIPEADAESPTLRERLETHLSDPYCASCHRLTDPIGLGFENFDGIGKWRPTENDAVIDPSGDLDGTSFTNAWDLAQVISDNPNIEPCFARHVYRYGTGRLNVDGEDELLAWLADGFTRSGHSFRELLVDTVLSPGFRNVGEMQ